MLAEPALTERPLLANRPPDRRALLVAVVTTLCLVVGLAAGCATGESDVSNDVLGVSVITSPLGRAHIAIAGPDVGVQLPDLTTGTTLGLSRDGEVTTRQRLEPGDEVTLTADANGLYELVAIEEGEATTSGDAELAPSTSITRLTVVRIGD